MPRLLPILLAPALLLTLAPAAPVPKEAAGPLYFPTAIGTTWVCRTSGNPGMADYERTWSITAVEKRDGATHVTVGLEHKGRITPEAKMVVSKDGLFEAESLSRPFDPPLPLLRTPHTTGGKWTWEGTFEKQERSQTRTVRGSESVTVPAGTFTAVWVDTVEVRAGQGHQFR